MLATKSHKILSFFLIFVVCLSLVNVDVALADDSTPTETPVATEPVTEPPLVTDVATEPPAATEAPTEIPTEAPAEPTELPTEATPSPEGEPAPSEEPIADESTSEAPILSLVPENTSIVVLDEGGEPVSLATQDAAEALVVSDPVWCPEGVALIPGANNCSISYPSITALIDAMRTNPAAFDENGVIYLERPAGQGFTTPLILDDSAGSLAGSFATLSAFNLTVQGAWNGNTPATFGANTNFGVTGGNEGYILIGSAANPWVGNITLADITFSGISVANSVTVYTSSGDIVLSDVEVSQQTGTHYTAYLNSTSGDITVNDTSFFDGDNTGGDRSQGFYAETDTGSIAITGTGNINSPTFQDARGTDPANYNGATLSAPVVTLTDVISVDNDGNGIAILNANVVTLNNVVSGLVPNGVGAPPFSEGNGLSGVLITGTGSTVVTINGGAFNRNQRYGLEILDSSSISMPVSPTYDGNGLGNFYENTPPNTSLTSTPPSLTNSNSATFSFTGSDNFSAAGSLIFQCSLDGSAFGACTSPTGYTGLGEGSHTFQVRGQDQSNNVDASPASFTWIIDLTPPVIAGHADVNVEATSAAGAIANYTSPTTSDAVDGPGVASCNPASGTFFAFGDTVVNCTATDTAGNVAVPTSFTVHVVDTTGPVIAAHGNEMAEATSAAGAIVTYTDPTANDAVDGPRPVSCLPASGSQFTLGVTTVTCTATDGSGNSSSSSFTVTVEDTTPPTLSLPGNQTFEGNATGGYNGAYTGATATDVVDASPTVTCLPASPNFFPVGGTTVTCTATDGSGNSSNGSFTVTVEDTTDPIIASHANVTVEATSAAGAVVNYTSPATSDIVDGADVANCSPLSGSTFALGNTTVTCNAMDNAGNGAIPEFFTVSVVDTTDPVLTLPGTITAMATGPSGATVTYSASANDIVDGAITPICSPASGSAFPVGSTTVSCSATDAHGNSDSGTFLINVQDPDAPILSLPGDITVEATGPAGAVVTFSASANDAVDGNVPVTCTPASGSTFPLGTTTVGCSATDASNNSNTASFQVTVEDTTAPSIAAHPDVTVGTNDPAIAVTYSSPSTSDAVDGAGAATCVPASGSTFAFGDTTVTCTATDSSGNSATRTFVVHVVKPAIVPTPGTTFTASEFIVPITGGGLVLLDCNSIFWLLGIRVGFLNLCDYQATLNDVEASGLPGSLPGGYTFVSGLDVDVLQNGELVKDLPDGSGVRMDFPISNNAKVQYAVLYWSDDDGDGNGQWLEVSQQITEDKLAATLVANPADELYKVTQDPKQNASTFYSTLTTDKTGIFVLVSK